MRGACLLPFRCPSSAMWCHSQEVVTRTLVLCCFKKKFRFIFMCECLAYVYMCTGCKPGDHGNQKKASDPLELELDVVVSCCVGAGNQVQVFRKSNSALHHWAISPALAPCFLDTSSFYSLCNVLSFVYFVKIIENMDSQEVTSCVELWLQVSRGATAC